MTKEDKPEGEPDEDERARRAAADELQKQIDALVRGDAEALPEKPQSLRDFIEHSGGLHPHKPQSHDDKSPAEASPQQVIDSDAGARDEEG